MAQLAHLNPTRAFYLFIYLFILLLSKLLQSSDSELPEKFCSVTVTVADHDVWW
jgi:hypothetical protein